LILEDHEAIFAVAQLSSTVGGGIIGGTLGVVLTQGTGEIRMGYTALALAIGFAVLLGGVGLTIWSRRKK